MVQAWRSFCCCICDHVRGYKWVLKGRLIPFHGTKFVHPCRRTEQWRCHPSGMRQYTLWIKNHWINQEITYSRGLCKKDLVEWMNFASTVLPPLSQPIAWVYVNKENTQCPIMYIPRVQMYTSSSTQRGKGKKLSQWALSCMFQKFFIRVYCKK